MQLLQQLEQRGLGEEGLLRVAGLQPRVEALVTQIEADFYRQPETVDSLLTHVGPHELSALLKRLLRDLPQPLLSAELTDMFYQSHGESMNDAKILIHVVFITFFRSV